jgi:hypothetical protein
MGSLTAFGIYQRLDGLRPSPSLLKCGPSYRSRANIYDFQFSFIEYPHLIRLANAFNSIYSIFCPAFSKINGYKKNPLFIINIMVFTYERNVKRCKYLKDDGEEHLFKD